MLSVMGRKVTRFRNVVRPDLGASQAERNRTLVRLTRRGDAQAREALILENIPLAFREAKRFADRHVKDLETTVSDAILALIKSADLHDPDGPAKFSTYATFAIQRTIRHEDQANTLVHIPGRCFTRSTAGGPDPDAFDRALRPPVSLSWPDEDGNRIDIEARAASEPSASDSADLRRVVESLLAHVTPHQREVIERHFGLNGREPQTLLEIAEAMGVTDRATTKTQQRGFQAIRVAVQGRGTCLESVAC